MDVRYRTITQEDFPRVSELVHKLYKEDPIGKPITEEKINRTFLELAAHPDKGSVIVFEKEQKVVGYALLINFWSNEYGGTILNIDEIYVDAAFRNQGIGTDFVDHLVRTKFADAVALQLEVTEENVGARKLYERLGFHRHPNDRFVREL